MLNKTIFSIAIAGLMTGAGLVSVSHAQTQDRRSSAQKAPPAGFEEDSIQVDGRERWFFTQRPNSAEEGAPLVVLLHGGTGSMRKTIKWPAGQDWAALSKTEGFVLIAPNGTARNGRNTDGNRQHWNDYRAPKEQMVEVDDVKFLVELVDWAVANHGVDPKQVYVTGGSNGGMMTYRTLLEAPDVFAGGVAFIAMMPVATPSIPKATPAVPLMIANATEDPLSGWDGGFIGAKGQKDYVVSSLKTRDYWIERNGAQSEPINERTVPDQLPEDNCKLKIADYPASGRGSAPVRFVTMEGSGHTIPSRSGAVPQTQLEYKVVGNRCYDANGAAMAWAFLTGAPDPVVDARAKPKRKSFWERRREKRVERRAARRGEQP